MSKPKKEDYKEVLTAVTNAHSTLNLADGTTEPTTFGQGLSEAWTSTKATEYEESIKSGLNQAVTLWSSLQTEVQNKHDSAPE